MKQILAAVVLLSTFTSCSDTGQYNRGYVISQAQEEATIPVAPVEEAPE